MKEALIDMQRRLLINMADPVEKFGVSFVSICVAEVGVAKAVDSWNEHPIEGNLSLSDLRIKTHVSLCSNNLSVEKKIDFAQFVKIENLTKVK